jgi:myo-inositol-1(or 4)-monophosphatase
VRDKSTNDFVTATDEAAQAAIVDAITDAYPTHTILAEEGTTDEEIPQRARGFRWIINPLDGTTNFMHQVPPYAVSIALQENDALVLGVVLEVTQGELFTAVAGYGARCNDTPIQVTDTDAIGASFLATGFPYREFAHTASYMKVLKGIIRAAQGVRRHGSAAVDLARVASGRFDGFFETGLRPWDVAAGTLLVRESGGHVTDYQHNDGLAPIFGRQMCATNGHIHGALHAMLRSMREIRL